MARTRKVIMIGSVSLSPIPLTLVGTLSLLTDQVAVAGILYAYAAFGVTLVTLYVRRVIALRGFTLAVAAVCLAVSYASAVVAGGLVASGGNSLWGIISPLAMLVVFGWRSAMKWLIGFLVMNIAAITSPYYLPFEQTLPAAQASAILAVNLSFLVCFVFGTLMVFIRQRDEALERERELGSYKLVAPLEQGGMGEVWRAEHKLLARSAAIKIIRSDLLSQPDGLRIGLRRRFEREARATASLCSPHTVALYDYGVARSGEFYYVMELLEGLDLAGLVQASGPQPPARVAHLLAQVCHSLAEAHAQDLVHRDIKPSNIFVAHYGLDLDFVKVLDFGTVKDVAGRDQDDAPDLTQRSFIGTPAFAAPEQTTDPTTVSARSDLYSVGCLGWWLLTGELLFDSSQSMEMMIAHVRDPAPPPSSKAPHPIPPELDAILLQCLEKDPDRRPASADDLRGRLLAIPGLEPWTQEDARRWWGEFGAEYQAPVAGDEEPQDATVALSPG